MKNWDKRPSKMIPLNGLIASAQRRLEVCDRFSFSSTAQSFRTHSRASVHKNFVAEKSFVAQVMPHFLTGVSACPKG
jgi:hypothetical protein